VQFFIPLQQLDLGIFFLRGESNIDLFELRPFP